MHTVLISDVHANLEALSSVLDTVEVRWPDAEIVCAGDIVGYGPDPNDCIEILRSKSIRCVLGNHDEMVLGSRHFDQCVYAGIIAVQWTRRTLTDQSREFLSSLPQHFASQNGLVVTHGNIQDAAVYVSSASAAIEAIRQMKACYPSSEILVCGHTHHAAMYRAGESFKLAPAGASIECAPGRPFLINPGAVGQSRDGEPVARYAVFDPDTRNVTWHSQEYDYEPTIAKLRRAGLVAQVVMQRPRGLQRCVENAKRRLTLFKARLSHRDG